MPLLLLVWSYIYSSVTLFPLWDNGVPQGDEFNLFFILTEAKQLARQGIE